MNVMYYYVGKKVDLIFLEMEHKWEKLNESESLPLRTRTFGRKAQLFVINGRM